MEKSEAINELAAALCKAQAAVKPAYKESENKHFKHWYASLSACLDACESALADNGLSLIQSPISTDKGAGVETLLLHKSGQWVSDRLILPVGKQDAQAYGSAITYARRYTLEGFLRLRREDDDADAAVQPPAPAPAVQNKQPQQQATQPATKLASVATRVKATDAKLVGEGLALPGELTRFVVEIFKDKFPGSIETWPDSSIDEVREACRGFEAEARDSLLVTQPQIDELAAELNRTGIPWTRVLRAEDLPDETEMRDLSFGLWKTIMAKLETAPDTRR